jgi:ribosomal protein S18 acetylase RimI-like enzyme
MTELPDGWRVRRPTLDDVPEILALAQASDMAAVGESDFTAEEVREALTGPNTEMAEDCWVALDECGLIVGWAYPDNATGGDRDFLEVYVWPERGVPAQRPLLAKLLERAAERQKLFGQDTYTLWAGAIPTETPWIAALTDAGFTFRKQNARMQMSLSGWSPLIPEPPAGVVIRPVREADLPTFHAVIEEAFRDSDHRATEFGTWWEMVTAESTVSYDEWFVAEVDDVIAGVLQSSDSMAEEDEGWVKYLAVLRAYRKKGLGEALLRRAFATYAAKGRRLAGLGVDLDNPTEAVRLYRAVGMAPLYQTDIYQRPI